MRCKTCFGVGEALISDLNWQGEMIIVLYWFENFLIFDYSVSVGHDLYGFKGIYQGHNTTVLQ